MFLKSGSRRYSAGHHRTMSTGVLAIIIASVSALFTGANMCVSYLTYRRARPRLTVRTEFRPAWDGAGFDSRADFPLLEGIRWGYHVHLINRSPAAVEVDSFEEEFRCRPRWWSVRRTYGRAASVFKFIEGEEKQEIAPFGGVRWVIVRTFTFLVGMPANTRIRLKITLTNGAEVSGPWRKYTQMEALRIKWREQEPELMEIYPTGQLSFDDLEGAE